MTNSINQKNKQAIKQAMILSAGKGTRMRPLTLTTPKPLIDVAGQPLIVWHILALKKAGITDITVNCSWLADKLIDSLGDGSQYGVRLHWSREEGEPLETAGGIAKALHDGKLKNEPFILVNGDVWTTFDFAKLVNTDFSKKSSQLADLPLAHLLLIDNPQHNPTGDFLLADGLAKVKAKESETVSTDGLDKTLDGALDKRLEKTYTFAGISVIHPQLLAGVAHDEAYPLAPLLKQAMDNQQVTAEKIDDKWVDVGTPERLAEVNAYVLKQLSQSQ
ncbi:MAG: nucleotidyl transferase [Pseudomonadales bacterium]|nr:MAG: nucleotidyl transferase [Pseudomonadales bacterium]